MNDDFVFEPSGAAGAPVPRWDDDDDDPKAQGKKDHGQRLPVDNSGLGERYEVCMTHGMERMERDMEKLDGGLNRWSCLKDSPCMDVDGRPMARKFVMCNIHQKNRPLIALREIAVDGGDDQQGGWECLPTNPCWSNLLICKIHRMPRSVNALTADGICTKANSCIEKWDAKCEKEKSGMELCLLHNKQRHCIYMKENGHGGWACRTDAFCYGPKDYLDEKGAMYQKKV